MGQRSWMHTSQRSAPRRPAEAQGQGYPTFRAGTGLRRENVRVLPGDDLIMSPSLVTNHAATVDAPPEQVWPWMTQVGWHPAQPSPAARALAMAAERSVTCSTLARGSVRR